MWDVNARLAEAPNSRGAALISSSDYPPTVFSTLPGELVEEILIACAANNDAASVAAVAATSRRLYSIIYDAMDRHLWRSLFLTLFDDPRGLDRRPASGERFDLPGPLVN